jgi:predicted dinucleotide-utilizing enzyme
MASQVRVRVGIVGFGHLGQFLFEKISTDTAVSQKLEVGFVWNRTVDKIRSYDGPTPVPASLILENLDDMTNFQVDLIAEVSHPEIAKKYGAKMLEQADIFMGSPTALAEAAFEESLKQAASIKHGVYIPSGALWGADDIQKMADLGTLRKLSVTMKKHPSSLKVLPPLDKLVANYIPGQENIIYQGPVRDLCPLAPNNVNTMACAALAGHTLGFDNTTAILVADDRLNAHVIVVEAHGPETPGYGSFIVASERVNPAPPGAVTGQQTFLSFLASLLRAHGAGAGFHFC